jgi:hydrogenase expression/formation protein HypD
MQTINKIFRIGDREWRGIGTIPMSGLELRPEFEQYDADKKFSVNIEKVEESKECIAGQVLKGIKKPHECPQFGKKCKPSSPLGAPMVSSEGACAAYYNFREIVEGIG